MARILSRPNMGRHEGSGRYMHSSKSRVAPGDRAVGAAGKTSEMNENENEQNEHTLSRGSSPDECCSEIDRETGFL